MKPQELAPISVIMPAFNSEDTVGDAIQSVIAQTYTNLELIIVDDGSNDKTCQVIEAFADRRIKLIKHDRNKGQGAARNTAIAAASGDWITLIDADDFWARERLEKLLEPTKYLGSRVMIADDILEFYQTSGGIKPWRRVWKRQMRFEEETTKISLARYLSFERTVMQPLVPRQAIIEHNILYPVVAVAEDLEFYIRLMKIARLDLKFINFPGYYYRRTPGSISTHPERHTLARKVLLDILEEINFTDEEKSAIHAKIEKLNQNIEYMPFLDALRNRKISKLLKLSISRPRNLLEFSKRIPATLNYRFQVLLNKGSSR
jgi:succinoglycan biosynthesis protein ExoO